MVSHRSPNKKSVDVHLIDWEYLEDMRNDQFPTFADVIDNLVNEHVHYALYHTVYPEDDQGNVILPLNEDGEEA